MTCLLFEIFYSSSLVPYFRTTFLGPLMLFFKVSNFLSGIWKKNPTPTRVWPHIYSLSPVQNTFNVSSNSFGISSRWSQWNFFIKYSKTPEPSSLWGAWQILHQTEGEINNNKIVSLKGFGILWSSPCLFVLKSLLCFYALGWNGKMV